MADDRDSAPLEEGDRLFILVQACEAVSNGSLPLPEFQAFIRDFTAEQQRREASIHEVTDDLPVDMDCEFAEERQVGFLGIEAVNQSLALLAAFEPEDEQASDSIVDALSLFQQGVARVREAMRINRRNVDRPLWL